MANFDPVYISINDRPLAILRVMDGLRARREGHLAAYGRRRRIPLLLFLAGLPLIALDILLGYNFLTCTPVAAGLWIAALVMQVALARARPGSTFPANYQTAREVIQTLRDDLDPGRNFFGHVDLSGPQQPAKMIREAPNALGLAVAHYRDEWLSLKARLYDGNMLRLSAIERVKERRGYYRRGRISGKQKWKPPKVQSGGELKVRISVNPAAYEIAPQPAFRPGAQVGTYTLRQLSTAGGIIDLTASTAATAVQPGDLLGVLRCAYDQLQRKA